MIRSLAAVIVVAMSPGTAQSEQVFPARLAGHAVLSALSFVAPPEDAPRDAWISGKFTTGVRVDAPMSVDVGTQVRLPLIGQPVQGLSGFAMAEVEGGATLGVLDNGFGTRANSGDALLRVVRVVPDWGAGALGIHDGAFLRDPDGVVGHRIVHEGTVARYLTGGDFDPESVQIAGGDVWIGEEFGPFLLRVARDGRMLAVHPTLVDGAEARSPDHPALGAPAEAGIDHVVQRSGGFEGLALHPGTGRLWALFERPLLARDGAPEGAFLRAVEFDPATGAWTGAGWRLRLGEGAVAIGDLNFVDERRALVIERDGGEGHPGRACPEGGTEATDCFPRPARVKRVVLIDTAELDPDGFARRIGVIDLMDIADPDCLALTGSEPGAPGRFALPFTTIESVRAVDEAHVLVAVDNNLPFSTGRVPGRAADTEIVLIAAPEMLAAR